MSDGFEPDPERVRLLREVADDVRAESSESEQLAAILYRVSDLYDPDEETSPEEIAIAVRNILNVKERGGLER
jgi:2,4-dienoyl-CoA reductase-like NADH-dependent reductase (Old Yellow Enzyme family)